MNEWERESQVNERERERERTGNIDCINETIEAKGNHILDFR